jgi:hypothetical protein
MKRTMNTMARAILQTAFIAMMSGACSAQKDADPLTATDKVFAVVIATDFESGSISTVDVKTRAAVQDIAAIHPDSVCRFDEVTKAPFVIERFGADAVDILDLSDGLTIGRQYSVGAGSNPQDIAASSTDRAYIAKLADSALSIVNPFTGAALGKVDLSDYADEDGIPDITRLLFREDKVYALAAGLNNFVPTDKSSLLIINGEAGTVEKEVVLSFVNPSGPLRYSEAVDRLVIIETGGFESKGGADDIDGIVEYFDPNTNRLEGRVITASALGGDIIDAVIVRPDKGFAIVERANGNDFETALVTFDPQTQTLKKTLSSADGFAYPFMEPTPDGKELWLSDRTETRPGIRIFDTATDEQLTDYPIDVGLPPFSICFVKPQAAPFPDAGDLLEDGGGTDSAENGRDGGDSDTVVPSLIMEATLDDMPKLSDTSCPVPRAPVLTVIDAMEVLHFTVETDFEGNIETGTSLDLTAEGPDLWSASDDIGFDESDAPYAVKVFSRAVSDVCSTDRIFAYVYNVRVAYPGPAGNADSTAISMGDPSIVVWASGTVLPITYGDEVDDKWRTPEKSLGRAEGTSYDVVCIGEGGEITVTFDAPIQDDAGYDFAVFENASSPGFLDLAFVEVSTDGNTFARFDTASRTQDPAGPFDTIDTASLEGLAGKYIQGFGHPFDLHALTFSPEVLSGAVDLLDVRFVKFIDVIGDGSMTDSFGRPVYDPTPCTGSAGFDLDAVGVLHTAR